MGSLTLALNGLFETYSAFSKMLSPLLCRLRNCVEGLASIGRAFSPFSTNFARRSRLILRRSWLTRRWVGVGILLGSLGARADTEGCGEESLNGEFDTRLLFRTWLNDELVRRTGV